MNRIARCACGFTSIPLAGEPVASCICHCTNCKRRTGSAFGVSNYFLSTDLGEPAGELAVYPNARPDRKSPERYVERAFKMPLM